MGLAVSIQETRDPKILAVVAAPTSVDFFKYYQRMGAKTDFAGLNRVPPECKNRDSVQARLGS